MKTHARSARRGHGLRSAGLVEVFGSLGVGAQGILQTTRPLQGTTEVQLPFRVRVIGLQGKPEDGDRHGEIALAHALKRIADCVGWRLEFASFLAHG